MSQIIKLDKKEIDDNIKQNIFNQSIGQIWPSMVLSETTIDCIKKEIKFALHEINHSYEGTYVFLCQENNVFFYGLYKGEDSKIYLVKSFMGSVILVVKYERKIIYNY